MRCCLNPIVTAFYRFLNMLASLCVRKILPKRTFHHQNMTERIKCCRKKAKINGRKESDTAGVMSAVLSVSQINLHPIVPPDRITHASRNAGWVSVVSMPAPFTDERYPDAYKDGIGFRDPFRFAEPDRSGHIGAAFHSLHRPFQLLYGYKNFFYFLNSPIDICVIQRLFMQTSRCGR